MFWSQGAEKGALGKDSRYSGTHAGVCNTCAGQVCCGGDMVILIVRSLGDPDRPSPQ